MTVKKTAAPLHGKIALLGEPELRQMVADWQRLLELYQQTGDIANATRVARLIAQTEAILERGLLPSRQRVVRVRD